MAIINQSNILNLQPGITAPVVVHMSEGDVGTKLSFKLIDGANAWTDPGNVVAAAHGRRQDGTQFGPYACTISGDVVSFETDAAMAGAAGSGIAQIVLTDSNGNSAGSANFAVMVERATFPMGVTYTNDVSVYEAILAYVQTIPAIIASDISGKIEDEAAARKAADANLQEQIYDEVSARMQEDDVLSARMDEFSKLPSESLSTAADAELVDIRVKADGQTAATAGDAVREQIDEVNSDLDEIRALTLETVEAELKNPVVTESRFVRYLNGNWETVTSSGSFRTMEFPATGATKYRITGATTYSPYVPAVVYYNDDTIVGSTEVPTETTYTGTWFDELEVVTPVRCTKILLNIFIGVTQERSSHVFAPAYKLMYSDLINNSRTLVRSLTALEPYETVTGAVAWNGTVLQLRSNGAYEGWTTNKYRVTAGKKYHVRGCYMSSNPIAAYVDSSSALTPVWANPDYTQYSVKCYEIDFVVPDGITEVWASYYTGWGADMGAHLWPFDEVLHAPFAGLKWACVGDSLTEFNAAAALKYHSYVAAATGIETIVMGEGGSGYINPGSGGNQFYNRIVNVPEDADVVTIFGSGNDVVNYQLGNVTDTGTDTICGCINTTIDTLLAARPLIKLGIVTPCPWRSFPTNTENAMSRMADALITICRNRGIPCLDLYRCSGLRPWEDTFRELAYTLGNHDGVHPNDQGNLFLASHFENFLAQLVCKK